jgi:hypothetical protein
MCNYKVLRHQCVRCTYTLLPCTWERVIGVETDVVDHNNYEGGCRPQRVFH